MKGLGDENKQTTDRNEGTAKGNKKEMDCNCNGMHACTWLVSSGGAFCLSISREGVPVDGGLQDHLPLV